MVHVNFDYVKKTLDSPKGYIYLPSVTVCDTVVCGLRLLMKAIFCKSHMISVTYHCYQLFSNMPQSFMLRCTDLTLALFGHHFNIYCESYNVAVLQFRCKCKLFFTLYYDECIRGYVQSRTKFTSLSLKHNHGTLETN